MTARYADSPQIKGRHHEEVSFDIATVAIGLLSLVATHAMAAAEKVTPLMAQDLAAMAGKEGIMLTVEYAAGRLIHQAPPQRARVCVRAEWLGGDAG